jgi:hypothetical protein
MRYLNISRDIHRKITNTKKDNGNKKSKNIVKRKEKLAFFRPEGDFDDEILNIT